MAVRKVVGFAVIPNDLPETHKNIDRRRLLVRLREFLRNHMGSKEAVKQVEHRIAEQPLVEEKNDKLKCYYRVNAGMEKAKTNAPKGPFSHIAMKEDNGEWYALMTYEDTFGASVSEKEKNDKLGKLVEQVKSSVLPEKTKKALLDYIKIAASGGGRFSMVHSQATVLSYLDGDIPNEQLPIEIDLMRSWCTGKISEFLERQKKELNTRVMGAKEKELLNEMIDLALTRESNTLRAVAAINLGIYFEGVSEGDRIKKFGNLAMVFRHAMPAE